MHAVVEVHVRHFPQIGDFTLLSLQETLLGCISKMHGNLTILAIVHSMMGNDWIKMNI
jgi:hypothetical protein